MPIRRCLLALAAVLAVAACGTHQSATRNPQPSAVDSSPLAPPMPLDADYRKAVEDGVAAALHSTPSQLSARLRADPRLTLMNLAKPAGIAQDQLAAAILSALKDAADAEVRWGRWTAEQSNRETQYWNTQTQPGLISEVSRWLRQT